MPKIRLNSEKALWNFLHGPGRACADRRRSMTRRFNRLYPRGHRTSLRRFVRFCGLSVQEGLHREGKWRRHLKYLESIHPDAFALIEKYGTDYTPMKWDAPPEWGEPIRRACFANAWKLAKSIELANERRPRKEKKPPVMYVEGLVAGPGARPMLHAWNCFQGKRTAFDWTFYAGTQWIRYRGIPLSLAELTELLALTRIGTKVQILFRKDVFTPEAKKRLLEILEKRRKKKRSKKP